MKRFWRKVIPDTMWFGLVDFKNLIAASFVYQLDAIRFMRYARTSGRGLKEKQLEAYLWAQAHVIEKGLSLPETRLGYGKAGIDGLFSACDQYLQAGYKRSIIAFENALDVLHQYVQFHEKSGHDVGSIKSRLDKYDVPCGVHGAGTINYSKKEYCSLAHGDFVEFVNSRSSVRSFGQDPVPEELVQESLELARKSPSACNRQCWEVVWVKSDEAKSSLLALQNGSRGFGEHADSFLVITGDLSVSFGLRERRQVFIDCALYAMTLMNALHYFGVGVCPLNWSVLPRENKKMLNLLKLSDSSEVVIILAIGSLPDNVEVAKSVRKTVQETLSIR
ncbi:MAG: nitroreductase family protein [Kiritimatiellaeota bacterium]|nr:nitroreductase family protein [Kiritimatiellota bacterium]